MTTDEMAFFMRELDSIKTTVEKTQEDVVDVRERVTRLEQTASNLKYLLALVIAGVPVAFVVIDRITN
jgi:hypothetical protein